MAQYPILSRSIDLEGVEIDVTINAVDETLTFPAAAAATWGYADDASGNADSDSLAGRLATLINTHSEMTGGGYTASATYDVSDTPAHPTWELAFAGGYTGSVVIKAATATMQRLGLYGTPSGGVVTKTWALLSANPSSDQNCDGWWTPNDVLAAPLHIDEQHRTLSSESRYTSAGTRVYLGRRRVMVVTFDTVPAAYVFSARAAEAAWAAVASRSENDPYNVLDVELRAWLGDGGTPDLRLYTAAGTYHDVHLDAQAAPESLRGMAPEFAADPRRHTVTIPLVVES